VDVLSPSARTVPARTDHDGARRCRRRSPRTVRGAQRTGRAGSVAAPGVWSGYGVATERRHASRQALEVLGAASGAALMHHSRLSLTAAPLRRTHAACRREGGQVPSALLIPAEPPPLLARGAHFIHGPFQHQETSFRAPGRSLCTLNGGERASQASRSISPGPVKQGERTCERCEGGGHRPGRYGARAGIRAGAHRPGGAAAACGGSGCLANRSQLRLRLGRPPCC